MTEQQDDNPLGLSENRDWFLQNFVRMVNLAPGLEIGITLQIGGMLVSGLLVSGETYFEAVADEFASGVQDTNLAGALRESVAQFTLVYRDSQQDDAGPLPGYFHLKNARFFGVTEHSIPTDRGVWWRGLIAAVDGFTLGLLGEA